MLEETGAYNPGFTGQSVRSARCYCVCAGVKNGKCYENMKFRYNKQVISFGKVTKIQK